MSMQFASLEYVLTLTVLIAGAITALITVIRKSPIIVGYVKTVWRAIWSTRAGTIRNTAQIEQITETLARVCATVDESSRKLDVLVSEVQVNGGSSLRDMINSLFLDGLAEQGTRRAMFTDTVAFWESDSAGLCVFASCRLRELIDNDDPLGHGWITTLHPDDQHRITNAWNAAVSQKRAFIETYQFVKATGEVVTVQGHCHPILNPKREIVKFIGILTEKTGR